MPVSLRGFPIKTIQIKTKCRGRCLTRGCRGHCLDVGYDDVDVVAGVGGGGGGDNVTTAGVAVAIAVDVPVSMFESPSSCSSPGAQSVASLVQSMAVGKGSPSRVRIQCFFSRNCDGWLG